MPNKSVKTVVVVLPFCVLTAIVLADIYFFKKGVLHSNELFRILLLVNLLFSVVFVIGMGFLATRTFGLRKKAAQTLQAAKDDLEKKVSERTAELELRNRQLRELARQTLSLMENDRKSLAKELHDSIGGTLAAIKHLLEGRISAMQQPPPAVMPFEQLAEHLSATIQETRRITRYLRPAALDDFGLISAIKEYINGFRQFYPEIDCVHEIRMEETEVADEIKLVLYRVVQESLNNVGKHSRASSVRVCLKTCDRHICLQISDDGQGFDIDAVLNQRSTLSGLGLQSMKERVEICQGEFTIASRPEQGTRIVIKVPFTLRVEASAEHVPAAILSAN